MQSKTQSLVESCVNILIGYGVAVLSQVIIFPWFGINIPIQDNLVIGLWFTAISLARSYWIRRLFNWIHRKQFITNHRPYGRPAVFRSRGD